MKVKVFTIKPHMGDSTIDKVVDSKINTFLGSHDIIDVKIAGYSEDTIAVIVLYKELIKKEKTSKK